MISNQKHLRHVENQKAASGSKFIWTVVNQQSDKNTSGKESPVHLKSKLHV